MLNINLFLVVIAEMLMLFCDFMPKWYYGTYSVRICCKIRYWNEKRRILSYL